MAQDQTLKAIIDKAVARGMSDDDVRLLVTEHKRRTQTPDLTGSGLDVAMATQPNPVSNAMEAWGRGGPQRVVTGAQRIGRGEVAGGARDVLRGGLVTAAPVALAAAVPAMMAAPLPALATLAGGAAVGATSQALVERGASAAGLSPDQAGLAGDVAGLVGGGVGGVVGAKIPGALQERAARNAADIFRQKLTLAVPPGSGKSTFFASTDVERAAPYLAQAQRTSPVRSIEDAKNTVQQAFFDVDESVNSIASQFNAYPLVGRRISDVMARDISTRHQGESFMRAGAALTREYALDEPKTVGQAMGLIRELNAQLQGTRTMNRWSHSVAMDSDPRYAARQYAVHTLREHMHRTLEQQGAQGIRDARLAQRSLAAIERGLERVQHRGSAEVSGTASLPRRGARLAGRVVGMKVPGGAASLPIPGDFTRDELVSQAFKALAISHTPAVTAPTGGIPFGAVRGTLRSGTIVPPTTGADPSFVRGVPAQSVRRPQASLPPPAIPLGPGPDPSGVTSVPAARLVQRDPRTGRMRRIYTSETP